MYEDAIEAFQTCLVLCRNDNGGGAGLGLSGVGSGGNLCVGALVALALVYLILGQTDEAILRLHHVGSPFVFAFLSNVFGINFMFIWFRVDI